MKILVATDGSRPALKAVKYAAKLAALMGDACRLTLVSVHDDVALRHARSFVGSAAVEDYLHEQSEKELKSSIKALDDAGVGHEVEIRIGHVAQEIVACADRGKFDLIVVGSKGRSAVADLLVGSVAQRVLATARQPVVVVK